MTDVTTRSATAVSPIAQGVERTLVGRGLSFPLVTDATGRIALTSGDDVSEAIRMIVLTAPGERVMRPDFGCEIWDHVFSPINTSTLGQMAHAVRKALTRWELRIDVIEVVIRPQSGKNGESIVDIAIDYQLRSINDRRNLVFPFYVIPESEGR